MHSALLKAKWQIMSLASCGGLNVLLKNIFKSLSYVLKRVSYMSFFIIIFNCALENWYPLWTVCFFTFSLSFMFFTSFRRFSLSNSIWFGCGEWRLRFLCPRSSILFRFSTRAAASLKDSKYNELRSLALWLKDCLVASIVSASRFDHSSWTFCFSWRALCLRSRFFSVFCL